MNEEDLKALEAAVQLLETPGPKNQDPAMDSKNQAPANGELKDGELNAVTGGFGGNLAAAVAQGVVTGMMKANGPAKGDLK